MMSSPDESEKRRGALKQHRTVLPFGLSLRYFLAAAEELNITRAAHRLFITQQSLSAHVAKLEEDYGVRLFERGARLRLTKAGMRMKEFAQKVLDLDSETRQEMADISTGRSLSLSVGILGLNCRFLLTAMVPDFIRTHPGIRMHITVNTSALLSSMLSSGRADLCIASPLRMTDPRFEMTPLPPDRFYLIVPENILNTVLGLTADDVAVGAAPDAESLSAVPYLLLEEGMLTRAAAMKFFEEKGIYSPNILLDCHNIDIALHACSQGLGAAFAMGQGFHQYVLTSRQAQPLFGFPIASGGTGMSDAAPMTAIFTCRGRYVSRACRDFTEMAVQAFRDLTPAGAIGGEV